MKRNRLPDGSDHLYFYTAVVAWTPVIGLVQRPHTNMLRQTDRSEHEVELTRCRCWSLEIRVVRGNVVAFQRQLIGPRLRSATSWRLGAQEFQPQCCHSLENGCITGCPVGATALPVSVQNVEITCREYSVASLLPNK